MGNPHYAQIAEFIGKKGGAELLILLGEKERRYKHLKREVSISSTTLTRRLREAQELDLITSETMLNDDTQINVYRLEDAGHILYNQMNRNYMVSTYRERVIVESRYESQKEHLKEWILEDDMFDRMLNAYAEMKNEIPETDASINEQLAREKMKEALESVLGPPVPSEDIEVIDPTEDNTQSADEERDNDTEE